MNSVVGLLLLSLCMLNFVLSTDILKTINQCKLLGVGETYTLM